MRKYFYNIFIIAIIAAALFVSTVPVYAMEMDTIVDTITIENDDQWDGKIPADISWKTKQDKGQWIEDSGLAEDADSLLLVINSLDKILYLSRNLEGEWIETISADCVISGNSFVKEEELYGVYNPVKSFGTKDNPGSLLPYQSLTSDDYWILDPEHEKFGEIFSSPEQRYPLTEAVNLIGTKFFFNYGMIIQSEQEDSAYPSVLLSCLQEYPEKSVFAGIQIPETSLRMLQQCVDENTRVIIAGSVDELSDLQITE